MIIPAGMTEQEVLDTIEKVARRLAHKFRFGYHDIDDMKQQARMHAIKAMPKYDSSRPLENFLWSCVHNQLFNDKRNKFARPDKPYLPKTDGCSAYHDKMECSHYSGWVKRNSAKQNLMQPIELSDVEDEREDRMKLHETPDDIVMTSEIINIIDKNLSIVLRKDWIQMRKGIKVSKPRRIKLQNEILRILHDNGITTEEAWKAE
jgi:DNA-directed RNA polymerase specialized sigma24 family protein